jgi:hypothetical protein
VFANCGLRLNPRSSILTAGDWRSNITALQPSYKLLRGWKPHK